MADKKEKVEKVKKEKEVVIEFKPTIDGSDIFLLIPVSKWELVNADEDSLEKVIILKKK